MYKIDKQLFKLHYPAKKQTILPKIWQNVKKITIFAWNLGKLKFCT
jgi:hypothetical protein